MLVEKGDDLKRLPGIGDDLSAKIREIVAQVVAASWCACAQNCRLPSPNC